MYHSIFDAMCKNLEKKEKSSDDQGKGVKMKINVQERERTKREEGDRNIWTFAQFCCSQYYRRLLSESRIKLAKRLRPTL